MTYYTNEGKTYCVVGTAEGTVTSASGVVIASFSANEQSYFTAPAGGFVTISDETAIVTPVFKLAPSALVGESGGGDSPSGGNTCVWTFADDGTYTVEGDNPAWTSGNSKFSGDKKIISWKGDLPAMTSGDSMFRNCTNLTSFEGNLSAMTSGDSMFYSTNLTSFEGNLSAMTSGDSMFYNCTNLTEWNIPLPALTDGRQMFYNCPKLTSFEGDLPALTNGSRMFSYCKLDLASVQNIANTINDLTVAGTTGTIYIGMSSTIKDTDDLNTALEAIRAKGWTVEEQYK